MVALLEYAMIGLYPDNQPIPNPDFIYLARFITVIDLGLSLLFQFIWSISSTWRPEVSMSILICQDQHYRRLFILRCWKRCLLPLLGKHFRHHGGYKQPLSRRNLQYFDLACQITSLCNVPGLYSTVEQQEIYHCSKGNGPDPNIGQTACEDLSWGCLSFAMDNTDDPACYLYSDTALVALSQTENLCPQCLFNVTYWNVACLISSPEYGPLTCGLSTG
jgi:hypothetical protein